MFDCNQVFSTDAATQQCAFETKKARVVPDPGARIRDSVVILMQPTTFNFKIIFHDLACSIELLSMRGKL
jgi:hypothetical protein